MLNVILVSIVILLAFGVLPIAVGLNSDCTAIARSGSLLIVYGIYLAFRDIRLAEENQRVADDYEFEYLRAKYYDSKQEVNSERELDEHLAMMYKKNALENSVNPIEVQLSVDAANRRNNSIIRTREFWVVAIGTFIWGYGDLILELFITCKTC